MEPVSNQKDQTFWQKHRNKILIVGSLVVTAAGACVFINNWDKIPWQEFIKENFKQIPFYKGATNTFEPQPEQEPIPSLCSSINPIGLAKKINGGEPFSVTGHIRTMADSKTASKEQRELAKSLGIELGDHQTYVRGFCKNVA